MIKKFNNVTEVQTFIESLPRFHQDKSLNYMKEYLKILDIQNPKYQIIHVAGTNGKGSVAKMIESVLDAHHLKVGCFTSPYVTRFNERIRFNKEDIKDSELINLTNGLLLRLNDIKEMPTFFEFLTLLATKYFILQNAEYVILECGIGGTYDSTNVFNDKIDIITSISLDHTEILGDTKELILLNKLGIVKKNNPLIYHVEDQLDLVIQNYFKKNDYDLNNLYNIKPLYSVTSTFDKTSFCYQNRKYSTNLIGSFQGLNAIIAIKALEILLGDKLSTKALKKGLNTVDHKCRFEIINQNPLMIIDGAHNYDGFLKIKEELIKFNLIKKLDLVISIKQGKDYIKMLKLLSNLFNDIYLTCFDLDKAISAQDLKKAFPDNTHLKMIGIDEILKFNINHPVIYLGSLYFASIVRNAYLNKK